MIFENTNYRNILKLELEKRLSKNPSYSLRAFARDLKLDASRLSAILKGKHGLSRDKALFIAGNLGLSINEKEHFADLVDTEHARSKTKKMIAKTKIEQRKLNPKTSLTLDAFQIISDWYHYAILELIATKNFKPDVKWVAKTLGLQVILVEAAIERLKRLELLEIKDDGTWIDTGGFVVSPDGIPSESIRKFHSQVLEKAQLAIQTQKVETRDFSNMILAFDKSKIGEAKKVIKEFRRKFSELTGNIENKDSLYNLSINFFRLDSHGGEQ